MQACCSTAMKKGRREAACLSSSTWSTQRATSWSTSRSSSVCSVGVPASSVTCCTQMKAHAFFHLVERRGQLVQIHPFVLHADWCTTHLGHILNRNCAEPPSVQAAVDMYFYHSNDTYIQSFDLIFRFFSFYFKKLILLKKSWLNCVEVSCPSFISTELTTSN